MSNEANTFTVGRVLWVLIGLFSAVVGHHIHGSIFWAIIDWAFWPIVWCKWFICQEVSISIIKQAFAFFLN